MEKFFLQDNNGVRRRKKCLRNGSKGSLNLDEIFFVE